MSDLLNYKCPCCGGSIEFNSKEQKMKCPFCDTDFDLETLKSYDSELNSEAKENMEWECDSSWLSEEEVNGMSVYHCQFCGGDIVVDTTTAASKCPYCDNPVIMQGNLSGSLKPDMIIPFKLDKKQAKAALEKHLSGKRLLPKVFKEQNHIDEIRGVYVPFWLFNADADADIRYKAQKIKRWSDDRFDYKETSYFLVSRAGYIGFDNVPVDGSEKMANDLMESIEPFSYAEAKPFQTAFLSGYVADKYDVESDACIGIANERVKESTIRTFRDTIQGYDVVTTEKSSINLKNGSVKYALCPVWILNTTWNGNKYTFAMNGQTGKFVGNLPVDKGAFWRYFIGAFAVGAAIAAAISAFLQ